MRVLFAALGGLHGGVEAKIVRLSRHFAARGHQPRVLFLRKTPVTQEALTACGIPWHSDVLPRGRDLPSAIAAARARLGFEFAAQDFDALVTFGAPATSAVLTAAATANPSAVRVAAIVGDVGAMWREPPKPFEPTSMGGRLSLALSRAHAITVVSDHLSADVYHLVETPPPIELIPNGVDVPEWRADPRAQPPTAVCVANFLPIKGHDLLVGALRHTRESLTLVLCGAGSERERVLESCQQLPPNITVVEPETPVDVQKHLARAQLSIQPSRSEGMSNSVLESLAAGLPVVAFDCAGNRAVVEHGTSGVLVPEGDRRALAMVIDQLASNPKRRAELAAGARVRAHDFPWSATCEGYESLLLRLSQAP
jgi:glycosyltransferase involved in cell wall biosynthesis